MKATRVCSFASCERPVKARDYCRAHYESLMAGQVLRPIGRRERLPCSMADCSAISSARGLCTKHYTRWHRHGDPDANMRGVGQRAQIGAKRSMGNGYIRIKVAEKDWRSEHRWVMQQQLGRPLRDGENVHHRNGDKADNRPENLEVWVSGQPSGQRPEDIVAFWVSRYPDIAIAALTEIVGTSWR